jgi:hypothetical protein
VFSELTIECSEVFKIKYDVVVVNGMIKYSLRKTNYFDGNIDTIPHSFDLLTKILNMNKNNLGEYLRKNGFTSISHSTFLGSIDYEWWYNYDEIRSFRIKYGKNGEDDNHPNEYFAMIIIQMNILR